MLRTMSNGSLMHADHLQPRYRKGFERLLRFEDARVVSETDFDGLWSRYRSV